MTLPAKPAARWPRTKQSKTKVPGLAMFRPPRAAVDEPACTMWPPPSMVMSCGMSVVVRTSVASVRGVPFV